MVTISLSLYDFNFIIHSLQGSSMERVITMIEDIVAISVKHLGKLIDFRMIDASSQGTPFINGLCGDNKEGL